MVQIKQERCAICETGGLIDFQAFFFDSNLSTLDVVTKFDSTNLDAFDLLIHARHSLLEIRDLATVEGRKMVLIEYIAEAMKHIMQTKKWMTPRSMIDAIALFERIDSQPDGSKFADLPQLGGRVTPSLVNTKISKIEKVLRELEGETKQKFLTDNE